MAQHPRSARRSGRRGDSEHADRAGIKASLAIQSYSNSPRGKRMFAVMAYTVFIKWGLNGKELSAIVLII